MKKRMAALLLCASFLAPGALSRGCLVTGGTGGIGSELVSQLVARGHRVAFTSRDLVAGRALEDALRRRWGPGRAHCWPLDLRVARAAHVRELVDAAERALGAPLDLVVNNAAVCERGSSAQTFARAFRVNVAAPLATCGAVLPAMRRRGFGRVVNVSSGDGERVYLHSSVCDLLDACATARDVCARAVATVREFDPAVEYAHGPTPAYAWSKALLNRATQLAAAELGDGDGVLVNAACPGDVCTRMMSEGVDPASARSAARGAASLLLAAFLDEDDATQPLRAQNGEFLRDGEPIDR